MHRNIFQKCVKQTYLDTFEKGNKICIIQHQSRISLLESPQNEDPCHQEYQLNPTVDLTVEISCVIFPFCFSTPSS